MSNSRFIFRKKLRSCRNLEVKEMSRILEHKHQKMLSNRQFLFRVGRWATIAGCMVFGSLSIGALGYRFFENMTWLQATLNAAMILTGMGPVDELHSDGGKLFAIVYCLFSGMVLLTAATLLVLPVLHRLLHYFHIEENHP
jgi:hypothetical protein